MKIKYSQIYELCHDKDEPIIITKNGKKDLVVLSIDAYHKLVGKHELKKLLLEAKADIHAGKVIDLEESFNNIRRSL